MLKEVALVYQKQEDGSLMTREEKFRVLYDSFVRGVPEGALIEVYMNIAEDNSRSLGQLAKVHTLCRRLANHTGESLDEIKKMVKIKAGIYRVTGSSDLDLELLSFGESSRDQLSFAIQTCMEMGVIVGAEL